MRLAGRSAARRRRRWVAAALALLYGCSGGGPALPTEMRIDGATLQRGSGWSRSGISGVVFIPAGEKMDTASLQVGVLLSEKHTTGQALSEWSMEQYHRSPTQHIYGKAAADEACKVGTTSNGTVVRPFLALHVCRGQGGHAVCAEVDEKLVDPSGSPCPPTDGVCWERLCESRWLDRRGTLLSIVDQVLAYE